jgi:hypothetical protein
MLTRIYAPLFDDLRAWGQWRSELIHVFVVVDLHQVAALPLTAVSDYIAVLALTRISPLATCGELSRP